MTPRPPEAPSSAGGGTQIARAEYAYDETAPQASGITMQHNNPPSGGATYRGNPTSVRRWLNTDGSYPTTVTSFYDTGMPYQTTDPGGHTTTFTYSAAFYGAYVTQTQFPNTNSPNFAQHIISGNYDFNSGLLTSFTDENGQTSTYTYDAMNRPAITSFPDGGQTTSVYTDAPPAKVTTTTKITDALNLVSEIEVDPLGRQKFTRLLSDPQGTVYTETAYDALGRVWKVSNPYRSGDTVYWTETQYDALSRVTKVIPPDGSAASNNITTAYSGNSTTVTDQAGKQRRSFTDALGRLIQVDEPNPTLATPAVTTYTYDTLDNLTQVVQSGSRQRTFTYNSLSQLLTATNPESGQITYTYDNDGNLLTKTDARGISTTFGYDALHRLTGKTYSDGTPTATFSYDLASVDGLSITNPVGRLVKAATSNAGTVNSYDEMGRVRDQWQCTPSNCASPSSNWFAAHYEYNKASAVESQSNPMGFTLTHSYNAAGRLAGLTSSWSDAQHPAALFTADPAQGYHPHGALKLATLGNGLAESRTYNNRLQPTEMRTYDPSTQQDKLKLTYNFTDAQGRNNGNVMSWLATGAQVFSRTYTYDELNRIASMASPGEPCVGLNWTYDIWANRTNQNGAGGPCREHHPTILVSNRIAELGYDAAGNATSDGSTTFQYDAENRMISLNGGGGNNPEYVYDANGRRVRKKIGSTLTEFVYDVAGSVAAERESTDGGTNWTWTKGYVYLGGQMLVQYNGVLGAPGATTLFAHKDHLGSTRLLTKPDKSYDPGDVYDYLPFGESSSSGSTTHKFTGKERDSESGLDYFGARYFGSSLGRFMSADPLGGHQEDPQTLNRYTYVRNNPLRFTDPTGLDFYLQCTESEDNKATCQGGRAGTTDENGKFTATVVTSESLQNPDSGNTATVNENGVLITTGGQTFQGIFISNTPAADIQGSGAFEGFNFNINGNCSGTCLSSGTWTYNGPFNDLSPLNAARALLYARGSFNIERALPAFEDVIAGFGGGAHPYSTQHRFGGAGCSFISCPNSPHLSVAYDSGTSSYVAGVAQKPKANVPATGTFHVDASGGWVGHLIEVIGKKRP